jgi:hypothetical protein
MPAAPVMLQILMHKCAYISDPMPNI